MNTENSTTERAADSLKLRQTPKKQNKKTMTTAEDDLLKAIKNYTLKGNVNRRKSQTTTPKCQRKLKY